MEVHHRRQTHRIPLEALNDATHYLPSWKEVEQMVMVKHNDNNANAKYLDERKAESCPPQATRFGTETDKDGTNRN